MKFILTYKFNSRPDKRVRVEATSTQVALKKIDPLAYKMFTPAEVRQLISIECQKESDPEDKIEVGGPIF